MDIFLLAATGNQQTCDDLFAFLLTIIQHLDVFAVPDSWPRQLFVLLPGGFVPAASLGSVRLHTLGRLLGGFPPLAASEPETTATEEVAEHRRNGLGRKWQDRKLRVICVETMMRMGTGR